VFDCQLDEDPYRRVLTAKAQIVWPGWHRVPPLLQRKGGCEFLIGHPSPPPKFARVVGTNVLGRPLYAAAAGTATPGSVASTWKVGAVWVVMLPTRDEFQRTLDRHLGSGAVRLSDTTYMRVLVHEAFHAHQMTLTRGRPPLFGGTLDERQAAAVLGRLGDAESRLAAEGKALRAALASTSLREARRNGAVFAALRDRRRAATRDPQLIAAFERQVEWSEGTARYADLRLILLAGSAGYSPTPGVQYAPAAGYRQAFLRQLADPAPRRDGLRGRLEDLGAAEALLLDRLRTGWRREALSGKRSLELLLHEAVGNPVLTG
jgi:hypothetical protein